VIAVLALGWSRIEPDRNHFRAETAIMELGADAAGRLARAARLARRGRHGLRPSGLGRYRAIGEAT
jgi:hypothetical protein